MTQPIPASDEPFHALPLWQRATIILAIPATWMAIILKALEVF